MRSQSTQLEKPVTLTPPFTLYSKPEGGGPMRSGTSTAVSDGLLSSVKLPMRNSSDCAVGSMRTWLSERGCGCDLLGVCVVVAVMSERVVWSVFGC